VTLRTQRRPPPRRVARGGRLVVCPAGMVGGPPGRWSACADHATRGTGDIRRSRP